MFTIDRDTSVPLYIQLAQNIEDKIRDGRYPPGSKIPSETKLIEKFAVSRITVRQAMKLLSEKDLIVRKRGKGSFVQKTDIEQTVDELFGVYRSLRMIEPNIKIEFLKYEEVPANQGVREKLQLQQGEKVLNFLRLYRLEKQVLLVADVFIPMSIACNWTREDATTKDSLQLLREYAGVKVEDMQIWIRAAKANKQQAVDLRTPKDSPVLEMRRLSFSKDRKPLQYAVVVFHGETYELTTRITSDHFGKQINIGKYKTTI